MKPRREGRVRWSELLGVMVSKTKAILGKCKKETATYCDGDSYYYLLPPIVIGILIGLGIL